MQRKSLFENVRTKQVCFRVYYLIIPEYSGYIDLEILLFSFEYALKCKRFERFSLVKLILCRLARLPATVLFRNIYT